jgi:hypothetical protein
MRVGLIGVQNKCVSMLTPELLPSEIPNRGEHLIRRRSWWHREHQFVNQLWRLSASRGSESGLAPHIVDVEIPIIQEDHSGSPSPRFSIVGLEAKFSIPADVVDMFTRSSQISAGARQHFDDHFRRTLHSPPDVFHLCVRQSATILTRTTPPVAHNIEQWLLGRTNLIAA